MIHARRAESENRLWQIRAATAPHMEADGQRRIQAAAAAIADIGRPRKKAYELATSEERIIMIGGDYRSAGQAFVDANGDQVRWLLAQGLSLEDAVARSDAWVKQQMEMQLLMHDGPRCFHDGRGA